MRGTDCCLLAAACLVALPAAAHPRHDADADQTDPAWQVPTIATVPIGSIWSMSAAKQENRVKIEVRGEFRYFTANGIPDHETGRFPNRGNPNAIAEQSYKYRVPLNPQPAERNADVHGQVFGLALNGVPFDPGTAEIWSKNGRTQQRGPKKEGTWNYDALSGKINLGIDKSNAHVQPNGAYHYHGIPTGLVDLLKKKARKQMVLVGYAADGYPVYSEYAHEDADDPDSKLKKMKPSYRLKEGKRPGKDAPGTAPGGRYDGTYVQDFEYVEGLGDLDQCNGRTGATPQYPDGTYYYVLTDSYPFIPRLFHGTPDESFQRRPRNGGGQGGPGGEGGDHLRPPHGGDDKRPRRPPPPGGHRPPPP